MPLPIRGFVVCVGYDDLLAITLPRNAIHLSEIVVVTTAEDVATQKVVSEVPNARCFVTDAFYRHGARFNKGLALEECWSASGRHGWILIWDADIIFPDDMSEQVKVEDLNPCMMYGAPRLILKDPSKWTPDYDWNTAKRTLDRCYPGYFQLFRADDPHIAQLPWYDVTFNNAGGGDGYFDTRWPWAEKMKFPFTVLHLGERDANWFGRATKRADGKEVEGAEERK
ncbi:MAG: glycosyltransferase family 2 protein, partial [Burkholderiaceae bacterium]|nr:glycosyltransferase family 2 protein [Burkholderiaceae bacterium]